MDKQEKALRVFIFSGLLYIAIFLAYGCIAHGETKEYSIASNTALDSGVIISWLDTPESGQVLICTSTAEELSAQGYIPCRPAVPLPIPQELIK